MKAIQDFFLRAKHWHMFVLLFAIPQVASFAVFFTTQLVLFAIITAAFSLCILAWLWALGSFFASTLKKRDRMNVEVFRFALLYPMFYIPFFFWFAFNADSGAVWIIIPLHLLAMGCMFYILYFVSKSFVMAETGKPASFSNYVGPLILFWLYPLGVWIIQPKVNQLYAGKTEVTG
jgi:hypothetical protein